MNKLKLTLWKIGLKKELVCPICNNQLTKHGFLDDDYNQTYTCNKNQCKFNSTS
jgi:hypothetical protein